MKLDEIIKKRHSVRKFSTKKPDWRKIVEAIDMARLAPLAGNIPTIKFILVDDPEKIASLAEAAQQDFIADAHYIVVVCSNKDQIERVYGKRGERYMRQQAGAAIENFLLKITEMGLSTCWIGAFDDEEVKRILKIPEGIEVEAFFPIGYEIGNEKQKLKPDLSTILYFNEWKNKYLRKPTKIDT